MLPVILILLVVLLQCTAHALTCTASQDDSGQTIYQVPDFEGTQCEFQFANATDFVLANQEDRSDALVRYKNETTLITAACLDTVTYRRDCVSEGIQRTGTCVVNCTQVSSFVKNKDGRSHDIVMYVVGAFLLLVVLLLAVLFVKNEIIKACKRKRGREDNWQPV